MIIKFLIELRKFQSISQQNNAEAVTNENDIEIPKERYLSPGERSNIVDNLDIDIIMEHQKIINLLDNTPNQPTKFRTKNWVEINDDARRTYNTNS